MLILTENLFLLRPFENLEGPQNFEIKGPNLGALKNCKGRQKFDVKVQIALAIFCLISTPGGYHAMCMIYVIRHLLVNRFIRISSRIW